jgi:hypothetical protein
MSPQETLAYMRQRIAQAEEIAGEFLVRIVGEVGDDKARELCARANVARWRIAIDGARIDAQSSIGLARRHALSPIARDVERSLGRMQHATSEATLRTLLGHVLSPRLEQQPAEA